MARRRADAAIRSLSADSEETVGGIEHREYSGPKATIAHQTKAGEAKGLAGVLGRDPNHHSGLAEGERRYAGLPDKGTEAAAGVVLFSLS